MDRLRYLVQLKIHGLRIVQSANVEEGRRIESLAALMCDDVLDATIALSLFDDARELNGDRARYRATMEPLHSLVRERGMACQGGSQQVRSELIRELWQHHGRVPEDMQLRTVHIHARTFLASLESIHKALGHLARLPSVAVRVSPILASFRDAFPSLRGLRDSVQHVDERVQQLAKGQPIAAQTPMDVPGIDGGNATGAYLVGVVGGDTYASTGADGMVDQVAITYQNLVTAAQFVQEVLDVLPWQQPHQQPLRQQLARLAPPPPPDWAQLTEIVVDIPGR